MSESQDPRQLAELIKIVNADFGRIGICVSRIEMFFAQNAIKEFKWAAGDRPGSFAGPLNLACSSAPTSAASCGITPAPSISQGAFERCSR